MCKKLNNKVIYEKLKDVKKRKNKKVERRVEGMEGNIMLPCGDKKNGYIFSS